MIIQIIHNPMLFKIKTIGILAVVAAIFSAAVFAMPARATGILEVEFQNGTPLFNETNFLPGNSVTRYIRVTNHDEVTKRIGIEAVNYFGFPDPGNVPAKDLSRVLRIVISRDNADIFGGTKGEKTLYDFFKNGETYLSDLAGGAMAQYDIAISFPETTGNEWNMESDNPPTTKFDIIVGFEGADGGLVLPLPGGSANGGGGGLPPGLTILNDEVRITDLTDTGVTISWMTSYNSTSQVVYAKEGEAHVLNLADNAGMPPKYGYAHTTPEYDTGSARTTNHSVLISGLTPDTIYYFRSISHGSLAVSFEQKFTTLALMAAVEPDVQAGEIERKTEEDIGTADKIESAINNIAEVLKNTGNAPGANGSLEKKEAGYGGEATGTNEAIDAENKENNVVLDPLLSQKPVSPEKSKSRGVFSALAAMAGLDLGSMSPVLKIIALLILLAVLVLILYKKYGPHAAED